MSHSGQVSSVLRDGEEESQRPPQRTLCRDIQLEDAACGQNHKGSQTMVQEPLMVRGLPLVEI